MSARIHREACHAEKYECRRFSSVTRYARFAAVAAGRTARRVERASCGFHVEIPRCDHRFSTVQVLALTRCSRSDCAADTQSVSTCSGRRPAAKFGSVVLDFWD